MYQEPWFLGREVTRGPHVALFWKEQAADHGADDFMAGRDLLQVWLGHGQSSGNRAAVIRTHLVHMGVNSPGFLAEL